MMGFFVTRRDAIIAFLDRHGGSVSAIGTAVSALGTVAIVVLTCFYVSYSKRQWEAMKAANVITTNALRMNQRAWVQVELLKSEIDKLNLSTIQTLDLPMHLSNPGRSPAKTIAIDAVVEIVNSASGPSFDYSQHHIHETIAIFFPGAPDFGFPARLLKAFPDESIDPVELTPTQHEELATGKSYLAVFGSVSYADDFGMHWTRFCLWKGFAPGTFQSRSCIVYNDVGDQ